MRMISSQLRKSGVIFTTDDQFLYLRFRVGRTLIGP
jgi:hypothetical protein